MIDGTVGRNLDKAIIGLSAPEEPDITSRGEIDRRMESYRRPIQEQLAYPEVRLWKVLGLAGAAGVAATGIALARRRQWRNYDADELRNELHKRLANAS